MEKRRKTIAMCISGNVDGVHNEIMHGVTDLCKSLDINLLLFSSLLCLDDVDHAQREEVVCGENMIFRLIPFDRVDGLIIAGSSFLSEEILKDIVRQARRKEVPVVDIDDDYSGCFHVLLDDESGMEQMVRHVVEEHGLTRVNFISGVPGNRESEERLQAYRKVLEENRIPVDESRIGYGWFGEKALEVMEAFFNGTQEVPQAIICANDAMAIHAVNFLIMRGYRVPEDIVVTGCDGYEEASCYNPSITSVRRGIRESGELAVKLMVRIWQGKVTSLDTYVEPVILYNQSCGCKPKNGKEQFLAYNYQSKRLQRYKEFSHIIMQLLYTNAGASNLEEFIERAEFSSKQFGIEEMYFCMADKAFPHLPANEKDTVSYPDKMRVAGAYGVSGMRGRVFETTELLPDLEFNGDTALSYCFIPIYFKNRTLGYTVMKPDHEGSRRLFTEWLALISAQMGLYYKD